MILAQSDPTDGSGLPNISQIESGPHAGKNYTEWTSPEMFMLEPHTTILLDEFTKALQMVMNAFAQLLEERRIGKHQLSPLASVVAAGNHLSDLSGDNELPRHVEDRLCVLNVVNPASDWLEWASTNQLPTEITGYVAFWKEAAFKFDPNARKNPTQRSIAKLANVLRLKALTRPLVRELAAGYIGEGAAAQFTAWLDLRDGLPSPESIIADPERAGVPTRDKVQLTYAITSALIGHATVKTIRPIMTYLARLPSQEFTVFALKDIIHRYPPLNASPAVTEWKMKHRHLFTDIMT